MTRLVPLVILAVVIFVGVGHAAPRAVQPGYDSSPQDSPNGSWLLFERFYGDGRYTPTLASLRIARADGSAEREIVAPSASLFALWTPDSLIEVILPQPDGTIETTLRRPEDGSIARQLPVAAEAWSRDGKWIAYVENLKLYVARPDGSEARLLATAPALGWVGVGDFSPDSTRLTFVVGVPGAPDRSEVVRIDGTERHVLREGPLVSAGKWSPDGSSLVFTAQNDKGRYRPPRAWVSNADGTNPHVIAPGYATGPDWSPLGGWIVYTRQTSTRARDLYDVMIVHPDGTGRRRVVRIGGYWSATWRADGRHLLSLGYGACRRGGVIEIDAFARTAKRLTNRCGIDGTPGPDNLRGTPLRDLIDGRGGSDTINGVGGNDRISGGSGDDMIVSRDRYRDTVSCGAGADSVVADYRDRIARDCEHVRR